MRHDTDLLTSRDTPGARTWRSSYDPVAPAALVGVDGAWHWRSRRTIAPGTCVRSSHVCNCSIQPRLPSPRALWLAGPRPVLVWLLNRDALRSHRPCASAAGAQRRSGAVVRGVDAAHVSRSGAGQVRRSAKPTGTRNVLITRAKNPFVVPLPRGHGSSVARLPIWIGR